MCHSSGRCRRGSHRCPGIRRLKIRSLARLRSSSRRDPPIAASYPPSSSAARSATVFISRVYSWAPWLNGVTPSATASVFVATRRSRPYCSTIWPRNVIMSRNFHVVSTCSTGNGIGPGANALAARCSITPESLPML